MDEEKTIDEAVEEPADEMKEIEPVTFDDIIKDKPVNDTVPILRALGDPDPANMDMIHKHLDNFLAMLCGETPIDDNVRNSAEYWLKRLAYGFGGSTKKIYWHTIFFKRQDTGIIYCEGYCIILNNDPTPIDATAFEALLKTSGFIAVVINGRYGGSTDVTATDADLVTISYNSDTRFTATYRSDTTHDKGSNNLSFLGITVTDLGANPIN